MLKELKEVARDLVFSNRTLEEARAEFCEIAEFHGVSKRRAMKLFDGIVK